MMEQRFPVPSAPTKTAAIQRTSPRAVASNQTQRDCASRALKGENMKVLKILGIVFGILLLLTGGGLLAGSVLASKGEGAFEQELAKSGYTGPVEGTVKSVEQTSPVIVTVTYTDKQGKTQTGQGAASGAAPPKVGDKVSTYYSTSDPSQILVVNVPGLANLSGVAATLRVSGIICLIAGGVLLLAGILGFVLGKKPAAVAAAP